jgi:hypothetical protein
MLLPAARSCLAALPSRPSGHNEGGPAAATPVCSDRAGVCKNVPGPHVRSCVSSEVSVGPSTGELHVSPCAVEQTSCGVGRTKLMRSYCIVLRTATGFESDAAVAGQTRTRRPIEMRLRSIICHFTMVTPTVVFMLASPLVSNAQQRATSTSTSAAWNDNSLIDIQKHANDAARPGNVKIEFYGHDAFEITSPGGLDGSCRSLEERPDGSLSKVVPEYVSGYSRRYSSIDSRSF